MCYLAKKYGIASDANIIKWLAYYDKFGYEGLQRKKKSNVYTTQFKLDVINYRKRNDSTLVETALHFNLPNPEIILAWERKLINVGVEGLSVKRGRPTMKEKTNKKEIKTDDINEVEALKLELELVKEQLDRAQLENLYLKKLKAFLEDPKNYSKKAKSK